MTRRWWPFGRRPDESKQPKDPGERGKDRRLDETRRIARHVAREALRAGCPEEEDEPEPESTRPEGPTITTYGNLVHVNFHKLEDLVAPTIRVKDPVTRKVKRVVKRFDRSDVFYTKDGRLIDDRTRPGQG